MIGGRSGHHDAEILEKSRQVDVTAGINLDGTSGKRTVTSPAHDVKCV
jgi:hypothetical protein